VHVALRAEARDGAQHRRAGQALLPDYLDERAMGRDVVVLVRFADEESHQDLFAVEDTHQAPPKIARDEARPAQVGAKPRTPPNVGGASLETRERLFSFCRQNIRPQRVAHRGFPSLDAHAR
jgi:hypothetical protein